jgi:hypothetical protein
VPADCRPGSSAPAFSHDEECYARVHLGVIRQGVQSQLILLPFSSGTSAARRSSSACANVPPAPARIGRSVQAASHHAHLALPARVCPSGFPLASAFLPIQAERASASLPRPRRRRRASRRTRPPARFRSTSRASCSCRSQEGGGGGVPGRPFRVRVPSSRRA